MRIEIDFLKCESNGLCASVAPDIFEVNDDDQLVVHRSEPDEADRARVEQAARMCPKQAITIVD